MADLPRWVDRWEVDSPAMLGAYLKYCREMRGVLEQPELSYQPTWEGHLFSIIHHDPPWVTILGRESLLLPGIPERPCTQRACSHCFIKGEGVRVSLVQSVLGGTIQ